MSAARIHVALLGIAVSVLLLQACRQPTNEDLQAKPWVDDLEHVRPETRGEAIRKLAALKYRPAALRIARRINDIRPDVRLDAIQALGELGEPASVPALRRALSEPEWMHRKAAVVSLGKIGHESAIPILVSALADRDQTVGRAAAEALAAFGARAEDSLLAVLSSGALQARPNAACALGVMKSQKAHQPLRDALAVSNSSLRVSAILALVSFADTQDTIAFAKLLSDADPSVSKAAADAIARIGAAAVPAMLAETTNRINHVRLNAYHVLIAHPGEPGVMDALLTGWDDRQENISRMIRNEFAVSERPRTNVVSGLKPQLLASLRSPSDSIRTHALELLAFVVTGDDADAIIALLNDRNGSIRRGAVGVLAGIRDDRSRQALQQLARSSSEDMRFVARTAMASQGDQESVTELIAFLDAPASAESANASRVDAALSAIGLSRDRRAVPVLARMLATASHPTTFLRVCQSLSELRSPYAFDALASAADNTDWRYREGRSIALRGLSGSDPERAVAEYAKHLTSSSVYQENHHRETMLLELGRIADPRGVPCMVQHLVHDNEEVRRVATQALVDMKGAAVDGLLSSSVATNRTLRAAIAFTLAEIGAPALAAVKDAMRSPTPEVREVAAWTIGQMKVPGDAVALLADRLNKDEAHAVRAACAWAIGQIKVEDKTVIAGLATMLRNDSSASCRQTAAFSLGEIAPTSALPNLLESLTDPENAVRAVAAGALGRIADPSVVAPLRRTASQDQAPEVRSAANNALIAMGQPGETTHGKKEQ